MNLTAIPDIPMVSPGDDLVDLILGALGRANLELADGDILVVAQKIVSKAEGRYVALDTVTPSKEAKRLAVAVDKDARLVELILSESKEVVRYKPGVIVVEHRLGHVLANAGIDASNLPPDTGGREQVLLLPEDPNLSSRTLRQRLEHQFNKRIGVIISDSVGRAWRMGTVGLALGVAGPPALWDRIGDLDMYGRALRVTSVGFADQIAAAAALVMGEGAEALPVVKVSGVEWDPVTTDGSALLRPKGEDMFR